MGGLNERLVKLIFPIWYAVLVGLVGLICRRWGSQRQALAWALLVATTPLLLDHATLGNADLALAVAWLAVATVLATALGATATTIGTGDDDLLVLKSSSGIEICTPRRFLEQLDADGGGQQAVEQLLRLGGKLDLAGRRGNFAFGFSAICRIFGKPEYS